MRCHDTGKEEGTPGVRAFYASYNSVNGTVPHLACIALLPQRMRARVPETCTVLLLRESEETDLRYSKPGHTMAQYSFNASFAAF